MEIFKQEYEKKKYIDNFGFVDQEALKSIIENLKKKIKDGKIYKGKAGDTIKIYTCRLLECFAICSVTLEKEDIITFKVNVILFRDSSRSA